MLAPNRRSRPTRAHDELVIASGAKQSSVGLRDSGLLRRLAAPRNDERRVIFATLWLLAMTRVG